MARIGANMKTLVEKKLPPTQDKNEEALRLMQLASESSA